MHLSMRVHQLIIDTLTKNVVNVAFGSFHPRAINVRFLAEQRRSLYLSRLPHKSATARIERSTNPHKTALTNLEASLELAACQTLPCSCPDKHGVREYSLTAVMK